MKNKMIARMLVINISLLCAILPASAQDKDKAFAAADTSYFSVDKKNGWQIYNSYASNISADSVQLEVILQHDANINWQSNIFVGKIKGSGFIPQRTRLAQFNLLDAIFEIKVNSDGNCYLRLMSGQLPAGNPAVIPIKIFYKK